MVGFFFSLLGSFHSIPLDRTASSTYIVVFSIQSDFSFSVLPCQSICLIGPGPSEAVVPVDVTETILAVSS